MLYPRIFFQGFSCGKRGTVAANLAVGDSACTVSPSLGVGSLLARPTSEENGRSEGSNIYESVHHTIPSLCSKLCSLHSLSFAPHIALALSRLESLIRLSESGAVLLAMIDMINGLLVRIPVTVIYLDRG